MIKSYKVKLHPTKMQEQLLWQSAGTSRWAYNWTLDRQKKNYEAGGKFIQDGELRKELTRLKKTEEYQWLNNVSAQIPKQAVKDACLAYQRFFKGQAKFPEFKSRKHSQPSFYQRYDKLKYADRRINLEKIGWVKTAEPLPEGEYNNPRVKHDGLNWYLTVSIEVEQPVLDIPISEPVGIDLGIKNLAIVSTGEIVKNINKSKEVRRLTKKLKRLQRQASRQYEKIKKKRGESRYEKTSNLLKLKKSILKIHQRLKDIRTNHIHQSTSRLVKSKPKYIVIEDLNISGMMKNKYLARTVQDQKLYEYRRQLEYKCRWYGVKLIIADRFFPSSKKCSQCGQIKKDLKLSDRFYSCDCGLHIDRDYNASINLREYGKLVS
ncbi:MAG: RNA-guided endonuclease TnpB family protein [Thermincola sp.]|nr:RNA-guided endonuclease TnpB family protein [Thermincola sp.]MDT3703237.1 RNA-guided endonuclease TnpB family protein [Thermincola sp.]